MLEAEATQARVEVATSPTADAPLAEVSKGSKSLALDWPVDLPKATVDGAEATFEAGSTRDVQVTATEAGFNFRIILDKVPTTAPVYRLPVTATGVGRLTELDNGGFVAKDSGGTAIFYIDPPVSWDHSQDGLEAGPEETVPVDAKLTENADGQQVLELRPDFAWMSDPSRILPITIDPDVYYDVNNQGDTFVRQGVAPSYTAATADNGSALRLDAGYHASYGKARAFIMHQMPPRTSEYGEVTKATLKLYQWDAGDCSKTSVDIIPSPVQWNVHTNWNTQPVIPPSAVDYPGWMTNWKITSQQFSHGKAGCGVTPENDYETIDITKIVNAWMTYVPDDPMLEGSQQVGIPNYGLTVRATNETDPKAFKAFCAMNFHESNAACDRASRQPILDITYNTAPTKVVGTIESPVTCYDGDVPRVPSLTPTLTGTATDVDIWHQGAADPVWYMNDDEPLTVRFEVWPQRAVEYADPFTPPAGETITMTASGTASVNQGTPASWQVPGGKLVEGEEYVWRAIANDGIKDSPYYSDWRVFRVDTSDTAGVNCPIRTLSNTIADPAAAIVSGLVDAEPGRYAHADYDPATGLIGFYVARQAGQDDAVTAANAKTAATAAILNHQAATPEGALTEGQQQAAIDALGVRVVSFSRAQLEQVLTDLDTRLSNSDPALADVVGIDLDSELNRVVVAATAGIEDLENALRQAYGDKVIVEPGEAGSATAGPYNDNRDYHYGGMKIRVQDPEDNSKQPICTAAFPVKWTSWNFAREGVLTAGHCGPEGSTVYNASCTDLKLHSLGVVERSEFNRGEDYAVFRSENPMVPVIWTGEGSGACQDPPSGNKWRTVGSVSTAEPRKGGQMCKWGVATGFRCGYTLTNAVARIWDNDYNMYRYGLVRIKDNRPGPGVGDGDSGGPIFTIIQDGPRAGQVHALGVQSAERNDHEVLFYYPIRKINTALGTRVMIGAENR